MVQCFLAMLFGAAALSFLSAARIFPRHCACQSDAGDYGLCEAWQDCRTILSFIMGALMCHLSSASDGGSEEQPEACSRTGLHATLLF